MNAVSLIELVLVPLGGGIGLLIATSWLVRRNPEKYQMFSNLGIRFLLAGLVTLAIFLKKVI
jgi:hypothetical protein